ncbi:flagellar FlbD family protein [Blastococcus haudaquaticus]|uniref:Flagellar protein FlbD n=1 Tax=Blastococcus haudaquaticus TaxID=1938745 RepID=A0A286H8C0_9ACTN|nr:flagellar FlbD family protein [Blastococcus haudaquaticus]SOE04050.1 flagellar protein FlbD [Blastococcus haudaquaticus]
MIAVTCRNGRHFTIDPTLIERVEIDPDTVVHLVDGTKYVVADSIDHLLLTIRDHGAALTVAQKRLAGGTAELADHATSVRNGTLRVERRQYDRSVESGRSAADRRPAGDVPDPDGT